MMDDEADDDANTENKMTIISRALGVDRRLADSELLAFVTNKHVSRLNTQISRANILETWSCIPSTFKVYTVGPERSPPVLPLKSFLPVRAPFCLYSPFGYYDSPTTHPPRSCLH